MSEIWVVVAISCAECGDKVARGFFDHKPSKIETCEVETYLGGMFCIRTFTFKVDLESDILDLE